MNEDYNEYFAEVAANIIAQRNRFIRDGGLVDSQWADQYEERAATWLSRAKGNDE